MWSLHFLPMSMWVLSNIPASFRSPNTSIEHSCFGKRKEGWMNNNNNDKRFSNQKRSGECVDKEDMMQDCVKSSRKMKGDEDSGGLESASS